MRLLSAEAGIRLSQMRSGGDLNPGAVPAAGRWVADFRDGVGGGRGEEFGVFDPRVSAGPRGTRPAGGALWSGHQPGFTANRKLRKLRAARPMPSPRLGAIAAARLVGVPLGSCSRRVERLLGPHTPLRASSHRPRPLTRERNPAPRTATFGVCGRGPRAVPDPSLSTGQTDHPADGTGGSDRAEGVVAVSRWRTPAAVHTGSAHGGLRPPGRVRLPGGSGIPLADAPGGPPVTRCGHRLRRSPVRMVCRVGSA